MPFQLPANPEKELAKNTINTYKTPLNKLAKEGFDTPEKIMASPSKTVKALDKILGPPPDAEDHLTGEKEKTCMCKRCEYRRQRRLMLSAIFYTLPKTFTEKPNSLWKDFRNNIQNSK